MQSKGDIGRGPESDYKVRDNSKAALGRIHYWERKQVGRHNHPRILMQGQGRGFRQCG